CLFYFRLGLAGVFANASEIASVASDKFALHPLPRTLVESFVVQRPAGGEHQQQRADENDRARRSTDDGVALRLCFLLYERFDRVRRLCPWYDRLWFLSLRSLRMQD